jgi:predicted DNA-binding transcriptional regulator YafY
VKLFKQRWYLVALSPHLNRIMIYALDRIFDIAKLDGVTFTMPDDFYPEDFFYNYYGIIAGTNRKPEKVRLKVSASQANYLRSLPLHDTQEETERNEAFSISPFASVPSSTSIRRFFQMVKILRCSNTSG